MDVYDETLEIDATIERIKTVISALKSSSSKPNQDNIVKDTDVIESTSNPLVQKKLSDIKNLDLNVLNSMIQQNNSNIYNKPWNRLDSSSRSYLINNYVKNNIDQEIQDLYIKLCNKLIKQGGLKKKSEVDYDINSQQIIKINIIQINDNIPSLIEKEIKSSKSKTLKVDLENKSKKNLLDFDHIDDNLSD